MKYYPRSMSELRAWAAKGPVESKLLTTKVPSSLVQRVEAIAKKLGASKTEVVVALANEIIEKLEHPQVPPQAVVEELGEMPYGLLGCLPAALIDYLNEQEKSSNSSNSVLTATADSDTILPVS